MVRSGKRGQGDPASPVGVVVQVAASYRNEDAEASGKMVGVKMRWVMKSA